MWHGDAIYYLSDRGGRANLFAYDTRTKETRKLTNVTDFDIKFPSLGPDAIVYENGGSLYEYDLQSGQITQLRVEVPSDKVLVRPHFVSIDKSISEYSLSPDGKRALFVARGEVVTVPEKDGEPRNLTQTSGERERWATWSPDGKRVAYVSDGSGEDEIYVRAQDGKG